MRYLLATVLLACGLYADMWSLESEEAFMQGKKVWLRGNIILEHVLGRLVAQEAQLERLHDKGTNSFKTIDLYGSVSIALANGGTLACDGMHIDCVERIGELTGLPYVRYQAQQKEVVAESARLRYVIDDDHTVRATHLLLEGSVQLKQYTLQQTLQCALADKVEYDLIQDTMILTAHPKKRVLFYDTAADLQISAPQVQIDRVEADYKIQGMGDVRMSFKKEELSYLTEYFHWN